MKKDRRCDNCHAHVPARTVSWMIIQRMTRPLVASDWSLNSASRSCGEISKQCQCTGRSIKDRTWKYAQGATHPLEHLLATNVL